MRRVKETVTLEEARRRLIAHALTREPGRIYGAAELADVIWPGHNMRAQGAGGAASRVLKKLGHTWVSRNGSWGWTL